jgi:sporulation integral membrane protein YlbJ
VLAIIIGVVLHPVDSIGSAKEGFKIWVDILIPSLLPFIIGANLLIDLKLVDIIGYIINPITKFLFNVSGQSALIFMISIFSGYPVGAKLASEFRSENKMSKTEAQRLVAFCSTSGPLFIIGSVGTGMFKSALLGYVMLACHYLGAIVVGILYRNYGWETVHKKNSCSILENIKFIISDIKSVVFSKEKRETFFVLFGNAVFKGINTILMVGGFVIIFSVVFKILSIFKVIDLIAIIIYAPLKFLGVSMELCKAFISGLFEITIGCNKISMSTNDSLYIKSVLAVFLIGFSGISILAQCCTFLAKTDIDIKHYIRCKFLHGLFSASILFAIYPSIIGNKIIEGRIGSKIIESENGITTANFLANNKIMLHYMNNYNLILIAVGIIYISTLIYKIVKLNSKNRLNLK